ncbi:MAG TPA: dTMP kinase [Xanthobacteraceae bacterium]|nr:dTMP kinase [Xanthobacteraceae bacterium]
MSQPEASTAAKGDVSVGARGVRGKFITFEGGEGTGKSTQTAMLARRLESLGLGVLVTREPGGSTGAEIIRHVLLSGAAKPLGPEVEAMLFAAAREDHIRCTIRPALAAGKWVICDRFADSTCVYQGTLGQVDQRFLNALNRVSIGELSPDLTIVLDVPVALGLERAAGRRGDTGPDRFEAEDVKAHETLREAYLELAAAEPQRCVLIDASGTKEEVAKRVWHAVNSRLEPATAPIIFENLAS